LRLQLSSRIQNRAETSFGGVRNMGLTTPLATRSLDAARYRLGERLQPGAWERNRPVRNLTPTSPPPWPGVPRLSPRRPDLRQASQRLPSVWRSDPFKDHDAAKRREPLGRPGARAGQDLVDLLAQRRRRVARQLLFQCRPGLVAKLHEVVDRLLPQAELPIV